MQYFSKMEIFLYNFNFKILLNFTKSKLNFLATKSRKTLEKAHLDKLLDAMMLLRMKTWL
jgi:hypothetical protein